MKPPRILFALLLLLSSALFAQSDIPVSSIVRGNAPGDQIAPAVASDGTNFLVVWSDGRSPLGGLYASRVDFRGVVLDETGIRLGSNAGLPEVVWSGSSYVIVWQETTFSPDGTGPHYSIRVARIDANGLLIEAPRTIREDAVSYIRHVATNGSRIVIAYTLNSGSTNPRVALEILDRDARTVAIDVPVTSPQSNNYGATVTSNGSDFLVVWTATGGVSNSMPAAHVDASGNVVSTTTLAQALPPADGALVASDGSDFLVFTRALTSTSDELQVMRVNAGLQIVQASHPVGAPSGVTVEQPRVVFNGSTYLLVWTDPALKAIRSLHLDRNGVALDQPATIATWQTSGLVGYPNVASNGSSVLLVWNDSRFSVDPLSNINYDVMSRLVDATILIGNPERLVSISATRQTSPAIASGAGLTMAVWSEENGNYAARVTPSGALDGRGIQLSGFGYTPQVVFDGNNFLAAWIVRRENANAVQTARIDRDGHLLDTHTIAEVCATSLTLARGASSSLLAWANCQTGAIEAVRVADSGNAIDPLPLTLTPPALFATNPSASWNGSEYLVAWEQRVEQPVIILFPIFRGNVYATRVSAALTLIDAQPIAIAVSSDDSISNESPSVASNGDDFLVAWDGPSGIVATHVAASGVVDSSSLLLGSGDAPQSVWDGVRYLVAWRDGTTIKAAHVDEASNDRFTLLDTLLPSAGLGLTQTAPGRVTAIYTRVATGAEYGNVERAFVRALPGARTRVSRK
jgi:hypothetical protein